MNLLAKQDTANQKRQIIKTVQTFSSIVERPLEVHWAPIFTDGTQLCIPEPNSKLLGESSAYALAEHLLSRVVFETNFRLISYFPIAYGHALGKILKIEHGLDPLITTIRGVLEMVDSYRVQTLWTEIYAGSASRIWDEVRKLNDNICDEEGDLDPVRRGLSRESYIPRHPKSELDDAIIKTRALVDKGSFADALLGTKLIIRALFSDQLPPQSSTGGAAIKVQLEDESEADDGNYTSQSLMTMDPTEEDLASMQEALATPFESIGPSEAHRQDMADIVDKITKHLESHRPDNRDDVPGKSVGAPIVFETPHQPPTRVTFPNEDDVVRDLRRIFIRAIARRVYARDVSGVTLDPEEWIYHKASKNSQAQPFLVPGLARGFKTLLLVDRSTSMKGGKTRQVDFACRVLSRALDFPFVSFHIWTFRSPNTMKHDVVIGRYPKNHKYTCADPDQVSGTTPLHVAIRAAHNELASGDDYRSLVVLTDGDPIFSPLNGPACGTMSMRDDVRASIRHALKCGVPTYAFIVGNDITEVAAQRMFAHNYTRASPHNLGKKLIQLLSDNFLRYIKKG